MYIIFEYVSVFLSISTIIINIVFLIFTIVLSMYNNNYQNIFTSLDSLLKLHIISQLLMRLTFVNWSFKDAIEVFEICDFPLAWGGGLMSILIGSIDTAD